MATHSSILDWKIPWTEEPSRLHTVPRVTRVRYNWMSKLTQATLQWVGMIHIRELCSSLLYHFPKISCLTFDAIENPWSVSISQKNGDNLQSGDYSHGQLRKDICISSSICLWVFQHQRIEAWNREREEESQNQNFNSLTPWCWKGRGSISEAHSLFPLLTVSPGAIGWPDWGVEVSGRGKEGIKLNWICIKVLNWIDM